MVSQVSRLSMTTLGVVINKMLLKYKLEVELAQTLLQPAHVEGP